MTEDKTYQRASMFAIGQAVAEFWLGLISAGMDKADALRVTIAYVRALTNKGSDEVEA